MRDPLHALITVLARGAADALALDNPDDKARLVELVRAELARAPLTAGAALADERVHRHEIAVEWAMSSMDGGAVWYRLAPGQPEWCDEPTLVLSVWVHGQGWSYQDENPINLDVEDLACRARLVPLAEADADPATRGPL